MTPRFLTALVCFGLILTMRRAGLINRRKFIFGTLLLSGVGRATAPAIASPRGLPQLASNVAEILMLGFAGNTIESVSARILADHIAAGRIGAVVFVKENVGSREDVVRLVQLFSPRRTSTPLIAIDHEGGFVQRLGERHGFTPLPSARSVATAFSVSQARTLYAKAGAELAGIGFNLNLAPVIDLHDPASPAVGHYDRAFDSDPAAVAAYAEAFIDGFASAGIQCALKHFPGEGRSRIDSHRSSSDITPTWSERELEPYTRIIASGRARIVMSGHLHLATIEKAPIPITLSSAAIAGLLRGKLGFSEVAMTDDLDMIPISGLMERSEAVIRAIVAGNDLLMIRNVARFDPYLPQKVVMWVQEAIGKGLLSEYRIAESADRVRKLKRTLYVQQAVTPSQPD